MRQKSGRAGTPKRLADDAFNALIRMRDDGRCQATYPHSCAAVTQVGHVESRGNYRLRWEPTNGLVLCKSAHLWGTRHPVQFWLWFEATYPMRAQFIKAHIAEAAGKTNYRALMLRLESEEDGQLHRAEA